MVEVDALGNGGLPGVAGEDDGPIDLLCGAGDGATERGLGFGATFSGPRREQGGFGSLCGNGTRYVLGRFNQLFRVLKGPQTLLLK